MSSSLRIGTRGSPLALWQANYVADLLRPLTRLRPVELVQISTTGDTVRQVPLMVLGGRGVFTKEIQDGLLDGRVDVAVHSLKDLPTEPVPGLVLAAVPERGPVRDVFLSERHAGFDRLPPGGTLATSSARRRAQVLHRRADLNLVDIRGNIDTRLRKLRAEGLDGLILAQPGLERLGLTTRFLEPLDWMIPAVGQGALGIECRQSDTSTRELLASLDHRNTRQSVLAERAFLRGLGGGCSLPIAALGLVQEDRLILNGAVFRPDGSQIIQANLAGPLARAEHVGEELAQELRAKGAERLIGSS